MIGLRKHHFSWSEITTTGSGLVAVAGLGLLLLMIGITAGHGPVQAQCAVPADFEGGPRFVTVITTRDRITETPGGVVVQHDRGVFLARSCKVTEVDR